MGEMRQDVNEAVEWVLEELVYGAMEPSQPFDLHKTQLGRHFDPGDSLSLRGLVMWEWNLSEERAEEVLREAWKEATRVRYE